MADEKNVQKQLAELTEIEDELSGCVKSDTTTWVKIYRLMDKVEKEKLYISRGLRSYTAWVNGIATKMHVHVSLLWARKKAGRVYEEYQERQQAEGKEVPALERIDSISPDSLNLCEKVAGKNAVELDKLITEVAKGTLSREDLREAARAKRTAAEASGLAVTRTRHNRLTAETRTETETKITAADIVLALSKSSEWLNEHFVYHPYVDRAYKLLTEFGADTGTSRDIRRIDAAIFENLTTGKNDDIAIRGIEIKVSCGDLKRDHKMAEYTDFCDYFYIAIPDGDEAILELAKSVALPEWGILLIDENRKVKVSRDASRLKPIFRDKSLSRALIRITK